MDVTLLELTVQALREDEVLAPLMRIMGPWSGKEDHDYDPSSSHLATEEEIAELRTVVVHNIVTRNALVAAVCRSSTLRSAAYLLGQMAVLMKQMAVARGAAFDDPPPGPNKKREDQTADEQGGYVAALADFVLK
ncbi:unnamed protein product, partial [Chrysoparadoxa australica]